MPRRRPLQNAPLGLARGNKSKDGLGKERSRGGRFSSYFVGGCPQYCFDSASVLTAMSAFSPTVLRVLGLGTTHGLRRENSTGLVSNCPPRTQR
jgi:hypothetical protein